MLAKSPKQAGWFATTSDSMKAAKLEIDNWLYDQVKGIVQSGPFEGMKLLRDSHWKESRLSPLLLGCYEEELHGVINLQINRLKNWERAPHIAVVGCAEGYYAIGLKRRLPNAIVYAIDSDNESLRILKDAARENNVEIIAGQAVAKVFSALDFIMMDCEGAEVEYLDFDKFPTLASSHILVEVHNYPEQKTDDILLNRFRGTHRIDMILEGPRDPNRYKELCPMTSDYRWMAVCEDRPCLMGWYSMTPRGLSVS